MRSPRKSFTLSEGSELRRNSKDDTAEFQPKNSSHHSDEGRPESPAADKIRDKLIALKATAVMNKRSNSKAFTMFDLMLSGVQSVDMDKRASELDEGEDGEGPAPPTLWIPNPPGAEEEEYEKPAVKPKKKPARLKTTELARQGDTQVQDYWKFHAGWPDCWPDISEASQEQRRFLQLFNAHSAHHVKDGSKQLIGLRAFVVVWPETVSVKSLPTIEDECHSGRRLAPGQCVMAESLVTLRDVRYLKLQGGGWVNHYDHNDCQVVAEMLRIDVGLWWYQVVCCDYVEVRQVPTFDNDARTGFVMCPGEVCVVSCRCDILGHRFFQLADGRGWVFETKPEGSGANPDGSFTVLAECDDSTHLHAALENSAEEEPATTPKNSGVEHGRWQYEVLDAPVLALGAVMRGAILMPGEVMNVNLRVPANGEKTKEVSSQHVQTILNRTWLRLEDGRGWIPKTDVYKNKPLVKFVGITMDSAEVSRSTLKDDTPASWMAGLV